MACASDVMNIAAYYIGTHEDPMGSNNVIFNTDYYGQPVSGPWYPWCCAFVWDIFRMAGASPLFYDGNKTAYCPTVVSWGQSENLVVPYSYAKYGDLVLFDWNNDGVADHIGFVEKLNGDNTLTTIEGNTSDSDHSNGGYVLRRTRYPENVLCIIHPLYDEDNEGYHFKTEQIQYGDTGRHVFRAQVILKSRGYYTGKIDESFGDMMLQAVLDFQRDAGIDTDGVVGPQTWFCLLHLASDDDGWIWRYVQYGDNIHTDSVLLLQEFLDGNYKTFYTGDLDGQFGKGTKKALINYCKYYNKKYKLSMPTDGTFDESVAHFMMG